MGVKENIKIARIKEGITLDELQDRTEISKTTLHRYENGIISNIPADKIERIATALNTTPAHLMGWDTKEDESKREKQIISSKDQDILNKYHSLDEKGKHLIDTLLYVECMRCMDK